MVGNPFAIQFGIVMGQCVERWPRTNTSRTYEVFGDLLELALARGYADSAMEHLIQDVSAVVALVKEAFDVMVLDNPPHNRATMALSPNPFADVLLCANVCHRRREFSSLHRLFASPDLVR